MEAGGNIALQVILRNAREVGKGRYSHLECPNCKTMSVEAYFSQHNTQDKYGIWFECERCGAIDHISCSSQPEGFTFLRVSERFQELDERAWDAEKR